MPTAHEFDQAARSFDRAAEEIEMLLQAPPRPVDVATLQGGMLTMLTDITIAASIDTARAVSAGLIQRASTCRDRAEVCRAYGDAMATYARQLRAFDEAMVAFDPTDPSASAPVRPGRPRRPAEWVELS